MEQINAGNMTGVPEGLAWIAVDDVPTQAEFKVVDIPGVDRSIL